MFNNSKLMLKLTLNNSKKFPQFFLITTCNSSTNHIPPFWKHYEPNEFQDIKKYVGKKHKPFNYIYGCGMPLTGSLGIPNLVVPQNSKNEPVECLDTPQRIYFPNTSKLVDFDCGYGFSVFIKKDKFGQQVWGCGVNTSSQLGYQAVINNNQQKEELALLIKPSPITLPLVSPKKTNLIKVSCGRAHTVLLSDIEGIFTLGSNSFGQCGRPIIEGEIFEGSRKIHNIPQKIFSSPVCDVVCGMDHTLFLTTNGEVYSCGWNADGQTGINSNQCVETPTKLKGDLEGKKIVSLSTFADTNLALADNGEIFGWGNAEYGQFSCVSSSTQVLSPTYLPFKRQGKITQVAAGGSSCLLLNEDGDVWVWGYGILGKGPAVEKTIWPVRIPPTLFGLSEFNKNIFVTQIASGLGHFMAINNRGELFSWGKNGYGCLGIQRKTDQYFPWKVIVGSEVIKVKLGVDHSIFWSKSCF